MLNKFMNTSFIILISLQIVCFFFADFNIYFQCGEEFSNYFIHIHGIAFASHSSMNINMLYILNIILTIGVWCCMQKNCSNSIKCKLNEIENMNKHIFYYSTQPTEVIKYFQKNIKCRKHVIHCKYLTSDCKY